MIFRLILGAFLATTCVDAIEDFGDVDRIRFIAIDALRIKPDMVKIGACRWRDQMWREGNVKAIGLNDRTWALKLYVWCGALPGNTI